VRELGGWQRSALSALKVVVQVFLLQFGGLVEQIRVKTLLRPLAGAGDGDVLCVVSFLKASPW
jgi:hypothetical protein